jgi:hypothetical protein
MGMLRNPYKERLAPLAVLATQVRQIKNYIMLNRATCYINNTGESEINQHLTLKFLL